MKPLKPIFASLAAAGLLTAQPAAAATQARTATPVVDSEQLAGNPSAAWPAIIAIFAVAIVAILSSTNDDDDLPVSP